MSRMVGNFFLVKLDHCNKLLACNKVVLIFISKFCKCLNITWRKINRKYLSLRLLQLLVHGIGSNSYFDGSLTKTATCEPSVWNEKKNRFQFKVTKPR